MRCSNCEKDIPFTGNVCPWCHTNKSGDEQMTIIAMIVGMIGMGIGYAVNGFCGVIAGALIGGLGGAVVAFILVGSNKR